MRSLYELGDVIEQRYCIASILGQGGTAITYEAEDVREHKSVAIKVLSLQQSQEWKTIDLFAREAQVLANLKHPKIPQYYDYFYLDFDKDRHFFIVQELIVGKSLKNLVERGYFFQEVEVKNIARQTLEILDYLHTLKPTVIHRDIKPHNLIKTESGEIYLVDFGSVQDIYRNTITRGQTFVGTIDYMSPEQIRGQASFASDLYSLGCTLLYLLTRRSPSELPLARMKINFRDNLKLSDDLANWLDKILEPIAEDRFTSAKEALLQLERKQIESYQGLAPIKNSNIRYQKSGNTLSFELPPLGIKKSKELSEAIIGCLLSFPIGLFASYQIKNDPKIANFAILIPCIMIISIFCNFLIQLLIAYFCYIYLKIDKNHCIIECNLFGLKKKVRINTKKINNIRIKIETISNKDCFSRIDTYFVIQEGRQEYKIGKNRYDLERQWMLEEICSFLEYLYPNKKVTLNKQSQEKKDSIWFNNLFDV